MTTWPEPGSAGDRIPLRELISRHGALSPEAALLVFRESLLELAPSPEDIRRFRQRQLTVSARIGQATEPLCGLMAWGMAASPADRPASATDLVAELTPQSFGRWSPGWEQRTSFILTPTPA